jgi:undecaprenyl diphosphate synthase
MQSSLHNKETMHVAMIMDGNGRWAMRRRLPRTAGHRAGVETIRRITEAAPGFGIGTLSLFAFSSDNWRRPRDEVGALMGLLRLYLQEEIGHLAASGIRLSVIGRRDRLPEGIAEAIEGAESATRAGRRLHLRIAVDYSARDAILDAAVRIRENATREAMIACLAPDASAVDLLIRTGGEQRLSDFLLWECAYAELAFTECAWPDFGPDDLAAHLADYGRRDRRFGSLTAAA